MAYKFSMRPIMPQEIDGDISAEFTAQEMSFFTENGNVTIDINGHTQILCGGRQVTFTARADMTPEEALSQAECLIHWAHSAMRHRETMRKLKVEKNEEKETVVASLTR